VQWLAYSTLEFTKQLSSGSSGQVYQGYFSGKEVAIKVLEKNKEDEELGEFQHEFQVLSSIRGPNIVTFYGACLQPRLCLVMEYASRGSLYDLLNRPQLEFGWKELLGFAVQMAQGIQCLHTSNPQLLHRDIKSMNFLVTENWRVKVCDFGLARFSTGSNMSTLAKLRGTMCYVPPEICKGEHYITKSDIYSMAICFWEMIYRLINKSYQSPFAEYELQSSIQIVIKAPQGLRPTIPSSCPQLLSTVVQTCWDNNPLNRPSSTQLLEKLEDCQRDLQSHPELWVLPSPPNYKWSNSDQQLDVNL